MAAPRAVSDRDPQIEVRSGASAFRASVGAQGARSVAAQEASPARPRAGSVDMWLLGARKDGCGSQAAEEHQRGRRGGDLAERNQQGIRECVPRMGRAAGAER